MSRPVWKVALFGMALLVMGEVSASYLAAQTPPHHLLHRLQPPLGKSHIMPWSLNVPNLFRTDEEETTDHLVNDLLLREVVERMGRDLDSYLESRADKEAALSDYELPEEGVVPSIRDQEYLRHSSLWPSRYVQQGVVGDCEIQETVQD
ncbi:hypothetical protein AAG570_006649 [Ranatra chinensis]|uniref:Uncharacterized protein n=1 Tax=Ranatra chinensis TaxID=642074 RepID=A0ABD0YV93_9HEMI